MNLFAIGILRELSFFFATAIDGIVRGVGIGIGICIGLAEIVARVSLSAPAAAGSKGSRFSFSDNNSISDVNF